VRIASAKVQLADVVGAAAAADEDRAGSAETG